MRFDFVTLVDPDDLDWRDELFAEALADAHATLLGQPEWTLSTYTFTASGNTYPAWRAVCEVV